MKSYKNNDEFEVLRQINKHPKASQRELARDLGFSLGKLNYCLNELKEKGLVKKSNFKNQKNKQLYSVHNYSKGNCPKNKTYNQFYEKKDERV